VDHPKAIGDRTALAVMLALRKIGYEIAVPFGENTRYDLVIDDGMRLQRVQCKTGRLRRGAIDFMTSSSYAHHVSPKQPRDYRGQIDAFAVYCPATAGVYLIPIEEVQVPSRATLRVDPARNGQRKRIRLAEDYLIASVETARNVMQVPRATSGAR
jgi:hypothetical protein